MDEELQRDEADRMVAAMIYLITCHARSGCPRLACMVRAHMRLIARHPATGECLREICRRMGCAWEAIRAHDELHASSPPIGLH